MKEGIFFPVELEVEFKLNSLFFYSGYLPSLAKVETLSHLKRNYFYFPKKGIKITYMFTSVSDGSDL